MKKEFAERVAPADKIFNFFIHVWRTLLTHDWDIFNQNISLNLTIFSGLPWYFIDFLSSLFKLANSARILQNWHP